MNTLLLFVVLLVSVSCQDVIPGVQSGLGSGYDMKKELARMPLFQWTYNYQQTWKSPYTNTLYTIPDQMFLTEVPKGKIDKTVDTYTTFSQYIKGVVSSWGLDVGIGYGPAVIGVGFETAHGHFEELIKGGTNILAIEKRTQAMYALDVWQDSDLNPHILGMINGLPNTIANAADQQKYDAFISAVGTHYVMSAQFGGFLNFSSIYKSSMSQHHTQDWTSYQVGLSISWQEIKVGIDVSRNKSIEKIDTEFRTNSFNESDCVGGQCALLYCSNGQSTNCGYENWTNTFMRYPGMLPTHQMVYPITELIQNNDVKKNTLKNAVIKYLTSNTTTTTD